MRGRSNETNLQFFDLFALFLQFTFELVDLRRHGLLVLVRVQGPDDAFCFF